MAADDLDDTVAHDYLRRIGYTHTHVPHAPAAAADADAALPPPSLETLARLCELHTRAVPFENLNIALTGTPILLDVCACVRKILTGRGGFCFELNGAFSWLLQKLGYEVNMHTARVWRPPSYGLANTHLCLSVRVCASTHAHTHSCARVFVDVGHPAAAGVPVPFPAAAEHDPAGEDGATGPDGDAEQTFFLRRVPSGHVSAVVADVPPVAPEHAVVWRLYERVTLDAALPVPSPTDVSELVHPPKARDDAGAGSAGGAQATAAESWNNLIIEFHDTPVPYATFQYMCEYHQSNPASPFLRGLLCTRRLSGTGRVTLASGIWAGDAVDTGRTEGTWKLTRRESARAEKHTTTVKGVDSLLATLTELFGVVLDRASLRLGA